MIRVLRLMEYVYETPEQAQEDMERWQVPSNGSKVFTPKSGKVIRSSTIIDLNYEADDRTNQ
jgi:hypothetical protein